MSTMVKKTLAAQGDPSATWEDVTPEIAAEWLRFNTLNRPKKMGKIPIYAADMKDGRWPVTGATIAFGRSGRLLDGQNRLQAIIDSNCTIRVLIVRGLSDDIFDVIDNGARRTTSDVLIIEGYEGWQAQTGGTAARVAINLESGLRPYVRSYSPQHIRWFVSQHQDLMLSVKFLEELPRRPTPIPHSGGAALHYLMAKIDCAAADEIITQLYRGDGMTANHMVLKLRNNLLGRAQQGRLTRQEDVTQAIGAVIRIWNATRDGRVISHIHNAFPRATDKFPALQA